MKKLKFSKKIDGFVDHSRVNECILVYNTRRETINFDEPIEYVYFSIFLCVIVSLKNVSYASVSLCANAHKEYSEYCGIIELTCEKAECSAFFVQRNFNNLR